MTGRDLGPEAGLAMEAVADGVHAAHRVAQGAATGALIKADASPVTVADFGVQAIIASRLARERPRDPLVAEEDASALRAAGAGETLARVLECVRHAAPGVEAGEVLRWIDRGDGRPGPRFWTLDPIDGTKGLLRGGQYVVALALIVDGVVTVGVLGCPRLRLPRDAASDGGGLAVAVRGRGAWWQSAAGRTLSALSVSAVADPARARVLRSLEPSHGDRVRLERTLAALGTGVPSVPLDSQAKHVVLAGGGAEVLVRYPRSRDDREAIWDQAAGSILIEEAGGRVTDLAGRALDFAAGRRLTRNEGLVASNGRLHEAMLAAVHRAGQYPPAIAP